MDNKFPKRKHIRLSNFDYSQKGYYFITVCTRERREILSRILIEDGVSVGRDDPGTPIPNKIISQLTEYGKIIEKYINKISEHYENIVIDKYVIMPDHIHLLIIIDDKKRRAESSRPTRTSLSQVIAVFKRLINKEIGKNLFQTSFYDHIIRDEEDYKTRWEYIDTNPARWYEKNSQDS